MFILDPVIWWRFNKVSQETRLSGQIETILRIICIWRIQGTALHLHKAIVKMRRGGVYVVLLDLKMSPNQAQLGAIKN